MADMTPAARMAYMRSQILALQRMVAETPEPGDRAADWDRRARRVSEQVFEHLMELETSGALALAQRLLAAETQGLPAEAWS